MNVPLPASLGKGFAPKVVLNFLFGQSAVSLGFTRMSGDEIRYDADRDDARRRIASAGRQPVAAEHTRDKRFSARFAELGPQA